MASHGVPRVSGTEARSEQSSQKELQKIAQYKELVDLVNTKIREKQYTLEVLALSSKLLKQNPEYYTIWNHRRLILQHQFSLHPTRTPLVTSSEKEQPPAEASPEQSEQHILDLMTTDLRFLVPLLIEFPKCYWIWNHRLWLLQQSTTLLSPSTARRLWQEELGLVGKMLARDSRNFHGWGYRRLVVAQLEQLPAEVAAGAPSSMAEQEYAYTTKMISTNLSNFSAWHQRSKLIPRLLNERAAGPDERRKMLEAEFELISNAINTDPFDQSLWFYHQYLISTLSPSCPRHDVIVLDLSDEERAERLTGEMEWIRDILEDTEDCKWVYQALFSYSQLLLAIEGSEGDSTPEEDRRVWLEKLRELDPLRKGRWDDWERSLAD